MPRVLFILLALLSTAPAEAARNEIINLYDAFGAPAEGLTQDFGFSALVRYEGNTILFDGGSNADILRSNTEALGIDLTEVDLVVVSHAHFDHLNGLDYLLSVHPDVPIYFPTDLFWGANRPFSLAGTEPDAAEDLPAELQYFGGAGTDYTFQQTGRFWGANITFVSETTEIAPGVTLVATESPYMGTFSRYPSPDAHDHPSIRTTPLAELSMNLETRDGDVLLVGCSHSLVQTIVEETKSQLERSIDLVLGGYHLLPYTSEEVRVVATQLKSDLGVGRVAPTHCTGHVGFRVFREVFGESFVMAGLGSRTRFGKRAKDS